MTRAQRLLAIDDNLDSAELIARIANKCGYEARAIADVPALSRVVMDWMPDIITLDLCMPQDDGFVVLSMLREQGFSGSLLIISGQDEWLRKAAGRLATARGLKVITDMSKPINIGELRVALTSLTAAGASPAKV
jgi:two-component system, chemotaxis family, chemotaxis protein CheY